MNATAQQTSFWVLVCMILAGALQAQTLPIYLISENYSATGSFYDSFNGESGSYSLAGHQGVNGSVGYTSYYSPNNFPYHNSWSSSADRFSVSVFGEAGISMDGNAPYGTMSANAVWDFSLPNLGINELTVNFSSDNIYLDKVDQDAIAILLKRNGVLYDQKNFDAYPFSEMQPPISSWLDSLNNTPGDVWELSVQINEAAWNGDYVHVVAEPDLQIIPEPGPSLLFGLGCLLYCCSDGMGARFSILRKSLVRPSKRFLVSS